MKKFIELINSDQPTLVDFYADWCGPCQTQSSILKELRNTSDKDAKIIKVDIERNPGAARMYGITSIPTLLLFQRGEIVWRHIGLAPLDELEQVLKYHSSSGQMAT